jgi:hypothetical protein
VSGSIRFTYDVARHFSISKNAVARLLIREASILARDRSQETSSDATLFGVSGNLEVD